MKVGVILMMLFVFVSCNSEKSNTETSKTEKTNTMTDKQAVEEVVTKVFVNTDQQNWAGVEAQFANKVNLDYSSMNGQPAAVLTPQEITTAWKGLLPGFAHTHHQIGNFITEVNGNKAHTFCYGTATHFLEDENGNVWTVVGSYDFDVEKVNGDWKVSSMAFNYKYQDGNSGLIDKATENVKK